MKNIASLWIGNTLGVIERSSIKSFLRQGHNFTLYTYSTVEGIPDGVEIRDASEVYPCETIVHHKKTGSPALHSDLFRYALMEKSNTVWVDLDIVALKKFDFSTDWVIGFESEAHSFVGSAVLQLPESSKTLQAAKKIDEKTRGLPPTLTRSQRIRYFFKSLYYGSLTIDRWPYGSVGPALLTHYLKHFNELSHVMPQDVFYSITLDRVHDILTPGAMSLQSLPENVYAIHLWGKQLRNCLEKDFHNKIPKGSLLSEIISLQEE